MKKWQIIGATVLGAATLTTVAACGSKSGSSSNAKLVDSYKYVYQKDPETLDYVRAMTRYTSENTANFVSGLMTYNANRELVGELASKWEVSEDGKTYTYHIRKGVKWVDADGNEYAEVKPSDWVTSLKYAADGPSDAIYLVQNSIAGLDAYVKGEDKDFSKVGIKADDDKMTLTYTLTAPESFWNSKTTYGVLFPINEEFLKEKGADFGKVATDGLLYNGAYIATKFDNKSEIAYKANESYWDKKNVFIKNVTKAYFDGSKPEELYKNFKDGQYTEARLYPAQPYYKEVAKDSVEWTPQGSGTYYMSFNMNRQTYAHTAKGDDAQKDAAKKATASQDFRQAINFAISRANYNAQFNGEDAGVKGARNEFTPDDFVQVDGKNYGTVVKSELDSLNGDVWKDIDIAQGADKVYNKDNAKKAFDKAKAELKADGVEVSAAKPIHLDIVVDQNAALTVAAVTSMKNSVEEALNKEVIVDIQKLDTDAATKAYFSFKDPKDADYDIAITGWSPDFADPSTYLDIFTPGGSVFRNLGLSKDADADKIEKLGLNKYADLVKAASAITDDDDKRYTAFAKAEAYLLDQSYIIPLVSDGATAMNSKVVPFTQINSNGIGNTAFSYKWMKVQADTVSAKDYESARADWEKAVESAKK